MQVYDKNMGNITMLFYQKSKANSHEVAKKMPYILYIYSSIHTVHAACTSSAFERTCIKLYKKGLWCQEENKKKYSANIKGEFL